MLLLAREATAQQASPVVIPVRLGGQLSVQQRGERYSGVVQFLQRDTVVLAARGLEPRLVLAGDVDRLWVRGTAWKTGAIVGGSIAGAGVGLLASIGCVIVRSDDGSSGNEGRFLDCTLFGAALGFVGGGLIGGVVGAVIPKWHLRYDKSRGALLAFRMEL